MAKRVRQVQNARRTTVATAFVAIRRVMAHAWRAVRPKKDKASMAHASPLLRESIRTTNAPIPRVTVAAFALPFLAWRVMNAQAASVRMDSVLDISSTWR
jgi:hypothetical protein